MVRVAINGYGRIGRLAHRIIEDTYGGYGEVVAINAGSSTDIKGWMYLLKYDSVYGEFPHDLKSQISNPRLAEDESKRAKSQTSTTDKNSNDQIGDLIVNGKIIPVFSQKDPLLLPWKELAVDVVIESTGHFTKKEDLEKHIQAGAKKVLLSAPPKESSGGQDQVGTFVLSVNEDAYSGEDIISNASCTTNCIAPVAKIINDAFGIEKAMMTTIHAYTSDQKLEDGGHKDYRRSRAAAENIIPTTTGAARAISLVLPSLKEKFDGLAIRVPVPSGSLADFTFLIKKEVSVAEVNSAMEKAAKSEVYQGIVDVTNDPIVSSDIIGNPHSAIIDLSLTQVVGGNMVKIIAWYDNEFGYANRLVEEALMVGRI